VPTLTVNVVIETASERRARQLMGIPYLLARREGDDQLYRDFSEMADCAADPYLRAALRRVANRYHPYYLTEADRCINDALKRAIERQRAIAHVISRRSSGPRPLALNMARRREVTRTWAR
jgi:hypothetical protein